MRRIRELRRGSRFAEVYGSVAPNPHDTPPHTHTHINYAELAHLLWVSFSQHHKVSLSTHEQDESR